MLSLSTLEIFLSVNLYRRNCPNGEWEKVWGFALFKGARSDSFFCCYYSFLVLHSFCGVTLRKGVFIMAIPDNKKRVVFTLSNEDIEKFQSLFLEDKNNLKGRIYESDTLSKIINNAYKNVRGKTDENGRN